MERLRMICSLIIQLRPNVTNLELQKYLYFIQAGSLMRLGEVAFFDEIEAWQYGPVVPRAYREFKYSRGLLTEQEINLSENLSELIEEIIEEFQDDEAFELVERTHSYSSWIEAWNNGNSVITVESILACHEEISNENNGLIF